jgi:glycosyltransferase involved in cell wall biosynthesis
MNIYIKYTNFEIIENDKYIKFIPLMSFENHKITLKNKILNSDLYDLYDFDEINNESKIYKSENIKYLIVNDVKYSSNKFKIMFHKQSNKFNISISNFDSHSFIKIKKNKMIKYNYNNNEQIKINNDEQIKTNNNKQIKTNNNEQLKTNNQKYYSNKLKINTKINPQFGSNKINNVIKKKYNMTICVLCYNDTMTNFKLLFNNIECNYILIDMLNNNLIYENLSVLFKKYENIQITQNYYKNNIIFNNLLNDINSDIIFFIFDNQLITQKTIETNIKLLNDENAISVFGKINVNNYYLSNTINNKKYDYLSLNGLMMKKNIYKQIMFDVNLNCFEDFDITKQLQDKKYEILVNNPENIKYYENYNIIDKNIIYKNSKYLYTKWNINNTFYNYDYVNTNNFNKLKINGIADYCNEKLIMKNNNLLKIEKFINKRTSYLTMSKWGYPPYGGGENWLIDTMTWLSKDYASIMICFYDPKKQTLFDEIDIIEDNNLLYIQMTQNYFELIKIIKLINPKCISHQGMNRRFYMEISNLLNIPFMSGFCFWQDIIKMTDLCNVDMENTQLTKCDNFDYIYEKSDYLYSASQFVNNIIFKYQNKQLDIIETISDDSHFLLTNNENNININKKYVTMINIHEMKGGKILEQLLINTDSDIPYLLIKTEKCNFDNKIKLLIEERNKKTNNKTILIEEKISNIKEIYEKTKILLIGSLVDETFCKVAYEGMKNKIPIISTKCGNLKYLITGYADILSDNFNLWCEKINNIYNNEKYLCQMSNRIPIYNINSDKVKNNFINKVNNIKLKNEIIFNKKNVGIFIPWCDQGLGIQGREYYLELTKKGYNVHIMAFQPYSAIQVDKNEWDYPNVHYYSNIREKITIQNIMDFVLKSKISNMIFIELCFQPLYDIVMLFKILGIKCLGIPNIETFRFNELEQYGIFDKILCNNYMTYDLFKHCNLENIDYLGFKINHPFFSYKNIENLKKNTIEFYVSGGLNSIVRKNISGICNIFNKFKNHKTINQLILYVYIQGNEIPSNLEYDNENIIIKISNLSYEEIAKLYKKHDIFIHMGCHEGLGLGFYESIASGTPVLTINNPPNNEIIVEPINGWNIKYTTKNLTDNNLGITKKSLFDENSLYEKISHIDKTYNRKNMFESVKNHNELINVNYIDNLIKFL